MGLLADKVKAVAGRAHNFFEGRAPLAAEALKERILDHAKSTYEDAKERLGDEFDAAKPELLASLAERAANEDSIVKKAALNAAVDLVEEVEADDIAAKVKDQIKLVAKG